MAKTYRQPRTSDRRAEDWRRLSTDRLTLREHEAEMRHGLAWVSRGIHPNELHGLTVRKGN